MKNKAKIAPSMWRQRLKKGTGDVYYKNCCIRFSSKYLSPTIHVHGALGPKKSTRWHGHFINKSLQGDMGFREHDSVVNYIDMGHWHFSNSTWDIPPPPPTPHQGARPSLFTCSYVPVHGIPMINDPPPGARPALGGNVQMAQSRRRISSPRLKPICLCR